MSQRWGKNRARSFPTSTGLSSLVPGFGKTPPSAARPSTLAVPTPVSPTWACRCYKPAAHIQVGLLPHPAILLIQSNRSRYVLVLKPSPLCSLLLTGPNQENRRGHLQADNPPRVCTHLPLLSSSYSRGLPSSYLKPNPTGDLDPLPLPLPPSSLPKATATPWAVTTSPA